MYIYSNINGKSYSRLSRYGMDFLIKIAILYSMKICKNSLRLFPISKHFCFLLGNINIEMQHSNNKADVKLPINP